MSPSLLELLALDRQAARVERAHVLPHHGDYTVGFHTHNVVSLITLCWRDAYGELPRAELLIAAQAHDKGEIVTGDVPSPIKDVLGEELNAVDARVERYLFGKIELTDTEVEYLEAADRMELWLWCYDQRDMGNQEVLAWIRNIEERWSGKPLPLPFTKIYQSVKANSGVPRYTYKTLNTIGGLHGSK